MARARLFRLVPISVLCFSSFSFPIAHRSRLLFWIQPRKSPCFGTCFSARTQCWEFRLCEKIQFSPKRQVPCRSKLAHGGLALAPIVAAALRGVPLLSLFRGVKNAFRPLNGVLKRDATEPLAELAFVDFPPAVDVFVLASILLQLKPSDILGSASWPLRFRSSMPVGALPGIRVPTGTGTFYRCACVYLEYVVYCILLQ